MKTWNKELKDERLAEIKAHRDADRLVQGAWLQQSKDETGMHRGCALGCLTQSEDKVFEKASEYLQWPEWLCRLVEKIFESLPKSEAPDFFYNVASSVPNDVDITSVLHQISVARLDRLLKLELSREVEEIVTKVRDLHKDWKNATDEDWKNATSAAESAWSAAWSAWSAESAESAAESAAESTESAAESAAESARSAAESAKSAAEAAAWREEAAAWREEAAAWREEADTLIMTLKSTTPRL